MQSDKGQQLFAPLRHLPPLCAHSYARISKQVHDWDIEVLEISYWPVALLSVHGSPYQGTDDFLRYARQRHASVTIAEGKR